VVARIDHDTITKEQFDRIRNGKPEMQPESGSKSAKAAPTPRKRGMAALAAWLDTIPAEVTAIEFNGWRCQRA
jgi:hypothetical protein